MVWRLLLDSKPHDGVGEVECILLVHRPEGTVSTQLFTHRERMRCADPKISTSITDSDTDSQDLGRVVSLSVTESDMGVSIDDMCFSCEAAMGLILVSHDQNVTVI